MILLLDAYISKTAALAYNQNARRAYEKSQHTEDVVGCIKIIHFCSHILAYDLRSMPNLVFEAEFIEISKT